MEPQSAPKNRHLAVMSECDDAPSATAKQASDQTRVLDKLPSLINL